MKIPFGLISAYWRLRRGMTFGAQGIVVTPSNEVLFVRHEYRPGWHFPGGGVEWRETAEDAMRREVLEETGVVVGGAPRLHGLFANVTGPMPSDHIAVYVVRDWTRPSIPPATFEIAETRFFDVARLPADVAEGARRRLAEVFENQPVSPHW